LYEYILKMDENRLPVMKWKDTEEQEDSRQDGKTNSTEERTGRRA
jgi:hypothetical protein